MKQIKTYYVIKHYNKAIFKTSLAQSEIHSDPPYPSVRYIFNLKSDGEPKVCWGVIKT
jgi:hypothetical protein